MVKMGSIFVVFGPVVYVRLKRPAHNRLYRVQIRGGPTKFENFMKLTFTPVENLIYDTYVITVEHIHGDSDAKSLVDIKLKSVSQSVVTGYIESFEAAEVLIDKRRSYGSELPKDFQAVHGSYKGFEIPLERDYLAEGVPNYFASMQIKSIKYFDSGGKQFNVTFQE